LAPICSTPVEGVIEPVKPLMPTWTPSTYVRSAVPSYVAATCDHASSGRGPAPFAVRIPPPAWISLVGRVVFRFAYIP
jgi:hypothetical protein